MYTQELERWIQLNPDPAGQGIVAGQLQNVALITIGAVALVMTSVVGMRPSVISAFQLPQGTDLCEAYLRQNLAKATLAMDVAEYTAYYAAEYWKPFSTNTTVTSFETLTCLSDPAFVNNAAVQAHFSGVLNVGLIALATHHPSANSSRKPRHHPPATAAYPHPNCGLWIEHIWRLASIKTVSRPKSTVRGTHWTSRKKNVCGKKTCFFFQIWGG